MKKWRRRKRNMVLRCKSGEVQIQDRNVLLDFLRGELGLRRGEGGVKGVKDGLDVELIAPAPFALSEQDYGGIGWTFSTFDLDRMDERVDPEGWDFKRYLENPVVQWAHRYEIPAIGRADGLRVDENGLHGSIVFNAKEYDPFGWSIGERVKAGVIRAGSVGFRVLEIELPGRDEAKDGTALIFRKQELLEFSICNVPANPFALAKQGFITNKETSFPGYWGNIFNTIQP
jgi:HK97 family phage prohead protease